MKTSSILIVEADIAVRHPLAEYLRECGYQVVESATTDEAIEFLTESPIPVEVVLADAQAPGKVDGFGLATWMRKRCTDAKIILASTVSNAAEKAGEICEHGPLMEKPYHHQLLLERIKGMKAARDRHGGRQA